MDNKFLNAAGVVHLWNKIIKNFVSKEDAQALIQSVVEGYYYAGHFYEDAERTNLLTAEEGKIYIDIISNAIYRYDETNGYIRLTASGSSSGETGDISGGGSGISEIVFNDDYTLTFKFTDDTSYTTGSIRGEQGEKGEQGIQGLQGVTGKSAYESALDNGFVGSEADWLEHIKGEKGDDGNDGADGISPTISISTIANGYRVTITDKDSPKTFDILNGSDGQNGIDGADGKGIKSVSFNDDYTLTITLEDDSIYTSEMSFRGEKGDKGDTGADGKQGADGESVYHRWSGTTLIVESASGSSSADLKGEDGLGIKTIEQTTVSTNDNGENILTVTLTDGTVEKFTIKNGSKGLSAYDIAVANGYEGDEESWLEHIKGADITITSVEQSTANDGNNIITFSDGTVIYIKNGSQGEQGTGVTILGSYESEEALNTAQPTGSVGDSYLVNAELYVWSETEATWINVGTIKGEKGDKGDKGDTGTSGTNGTNGKDGKDGVSPIVTTTPIAGGTKITITDANGDTSFNVMDGSDGEDGQNGSNGVDGKDITITSIVESEEDDGENIVTFSTGETVTIKNGSKGSQGEQGIQGIQGEKGDKGDKGDTGEQGIQGIQGEKGDKGDTGATGENGQDGISCEHSWDGTKLTVISASGSSSADLKGSDGIDGVSPTINVSKSGKVTTLTITDKNGTKTATINDGIDGTDGSDATVVVDAALDDTSTNPIQNKVVKKKFDELTNKINNENIPDYWMNALDEGVEAINTAMATAGYNKSAFLFYSDVHWNYGSQMSPKLLKYLYEHTGMTKTFFGGDVVNNEGTDYDTMSYLWDWRNQLKGLPNHHSVVGNHDDGNITNNLFNEKYIYNYLLAAEETPDIVRGDTGLWYYIDSPSEHTRYLFLDTAYKGSVSAQAEFVHNALLTTPDNWHIVAIAHIWYDTNYDVTPPTVGEIDEDNAAIFLSYFNRYNNRHGDFADCTGWVEFCIGGHTHWDFDGTSSSGIPIILVETDSQHVRSGLGYTVGTTTEASVNGIIADYDNHKIYVVRIGRGESREIAVTNYIVSYTNVLPIAIDIDGSAYNGVGYKADTRWSTSSGGEKNESGIYISGYIPVSTGDIIRVKNIEMDKNNTITNACMVMFYSALGVHCGNHGASDLTTYQNAIWDENGMLTQFTIQGMEMSYIRLQASYIGEDSIVTVNQQID